MDKTVLLFDEDVVKDYLDTCIKHWRKRREFRGYEYAIYYIDAYQSMRNSLFGELLEGEDNARNRTQ